MNLRRFMPYLEQKARFENICFKVILFYAGVKNLCGKRRNNNRYKLCHARVRR